MRYEALAFSATLAKLHTRGDSNRTQDHAAAEEAGILVPHSTPGQQHPNAIRTTMLTPNEIAARDHTVVQPDAVTEPNGTSVSTMPELSSKHNPTTIPTSLLTPESHLTAFTAPDSCRYKFSYIPGFFLDYVQAAERSPGSKVTTQSQLGLLSRDYDGEDSDTSQSASQWTRFESYVRHLNNHSTEGESYKLIYIIRHGFGVHNQVMERVGPQPWKVSFTLHGIHR